jgi:hypothetical protein
VRERDPLVHGQRLDLVEHGRVPWVRRFLSEHPTGGDDEDRRPLPLHGSDLHRRRLGAQEQIRVARDIEEDGVPLGSGRMVRRDVEGVEVVPLRLHLGALDDPEAHPGEDVHHPIQGDRQGVEGSGPRSPARQGDVHPVRQEQVRHPAGLQGGAPIGHGRAKRLPNLVGSPTDTAAILWLQAAQLSLDRGERRLAAEDGGFRFLQFAIAPGSTDQGQAPLQFPLERAQQVLGAVG